MPESLSVAFGALLDALTEDPWAVGQAYAPGSPARLATFGLAGRGMVLFTIHDNLDPRHVRLLQITF